MAAWTGSVVVAQGITGSPPPPRLMFATSMSRPAWFAVTQSMPQITEAQLPLPPESSTFTA